MDRETLEALKSALRRFKGAFVVVSHNREFVTGLCTEEWHVKSGRVSVVKVKEGDGDDSSAAAAPEIDPVKAAEEAALIAKGAQILGGGQSTQGANGSSWAKGTQTNANKTHTTSLVKDEKGKTLSKKEQRLLEKKAKQALAKENGSSIEDGDSAMNQKETAAEKKAKREAKKLMKEGVDVSKLDSKFSGLENSYGKKSGDHNIALSIKELEVELEEARMNAARIRGEEGGYFGAIATENFTLPNPVFYIDGERELIVQSMFYLARIYSYFYVCFYF